MEQKKVVFIAGRTNVPEYWKPFEQAEDELTAEGYIPLSPERLPWNLPSEKKMQIHLAMLTTADAVLFLPGWTYSVEAQLLMAYAKSLNKPTATTLEDLKEVFA